MNSNPAVILLLVLGVLGAAVVITTAVRMRSSSRRSSAAPRRDVVRSAESTRRDMEEIMTELDGLARQVHARIDHQLSRLESAIGKCDERIDKLERLARAADGQPTFDVTVSDLPPPAEELRPAPATRDKAEDSPKISNDPKTVIYSLADNGLSPLDIAARTGRTTGEVELILSLRKTMESCTG